MDFKFFFLQRLRSVREILGPSTRRALGTWSPGTSTQPEGGLSYDQDRQGPGDTAGFMDRTGTAGPGRAYFLQAHPQGIASDAELWADPYVKLTLGKQSFKTESRDNADLSICNALVVLSLQRGKHCAFL